MARQKVDLIGDLAINRGANYDRWKPQAPGDWRLWTPKCEIRTNFLSEGGELLTSFEFGDTTYDPDTDLSTFHPYLTWEKAILLPVTKYQGGLSVPSVRNCYVIDFQVKLDNVIYSTDTGWVQVKPEVTSNA